jgi:glycosyltransferase involved in cell wall biosynthesis
MLGPDTNVIGGISTLVETIVPVLDRQVELSYLPTARRRPANESGRLSAQNLALALSQYTRFFCALLQVRPQIVHLHTSEGIGWLKDTFLVLIAKTYRCRVILHMHGGHFGDLYENGSGLTQFYTRKILRLTDAIIEVSSGRKRQLEHIVPGRRVIAFRNCIHVGAIPRASPDCSKGAVRALFMGVVGPNKGIFDLLEAMARLRSSGCTLYLWVAGGEEGKGDLDRAHSQVQELNLKDECQLLGMVRGSRKAALLRKANMFVLPSYEEALPMAILEAMAAGLPVISTPVGGIPEIVVDGYNGFLVPPGDVSALARKMAVLARNADLRQLMGRRSRELAERELDVKPYVQRLLGLYESIVKE